MKLKKNKTNKTLKVCKTGRLDGGFEHFNMVGRLNYLIDELVIPQLREIEDYDYGFYKSCMTQIGLDKVIQKKSVNSIVVWILFMSNKNIVETYIDKFNKRFFKVCPWSDIETLYTFLIYTQYYKKTMTFDGLNDVLKLGLLSDIDNENFNSFKKEIREMV